MRATLLLSACALLALATPAIAVVNQTGSVSVNGQYVAPTPTTQFNQACNGGAGGIVGQLGTVSPYLSTVCGALAPTALSLVSTGFQRVGPITVATGFTPPSGSTVCYIQPETNPVRFRADGTNPTSLIGQPLPLNAVLTLTASLATVKFIPQSGSSYLNVDCYK